MTQLFILHGWGGTRESNWFPWLRQRREAVGDEVLIPNFPNTELPRYAEWREYWETNFVQQLTADSVIVGHSIGGSFALRWLSENKFSIARLVLVAPAPDDCGVGEIADFFTKRWDADWLKKNIERIELLGADNDPFISLQKFEKLAESLGAEFQLCAGGGHLNDTSLPECF